MLRIRLMEPFSRQVCALLVAWASCGSPAGAAISPPSPAPEAKSERADTPEQTAAIAPQVSGAVEGFSLEDLELGPPPKLAHGVEALPVSSQPAPSQPHAPARARTMTEGIHFQTVRCSGIPCTRPGVARVVAGVAGFFSMAGGTALIMLVPRWSEPGGYFAGTGPVAMVGALVGTIVGVLSDERTSVDDRVAPLTIGGSFLRGAQAPFGETNPASLSAQASPILRLKGQRAYVRVSGDAGSLLGPKRVVDPRPQANFSSAGKLFHWSFNSSIEFGIWTPYPAKRLKRHAHFGPVEILARMNLSIRRERMSTASGEVRSVERVMFVPLTPGIRWHLSARQRLTTYVGPRVDFANVASDGGRIDSRGGAQWGRSYGETWYEIDFPLTAHLRQYSAQVQRWNGSGQLRLGYRHSMFDGRGLNSDAVVGFTGPMYVGWAMRWRSPGAAWAMQANAGVWIANEWATHFDFGIVAPDIRPSRYRALYRWKSISQKIRAGEKVEPEVVDDSQVVPDVEAARTRESTLNSVPIAVPRREESQ
jgi:hypothetical protein